MMLLVDKQDGPRPRPISGGSVPGSDPAVRSLALVVSTQPVDRREVADTLRLIGQAGLEVAEVSSMAEAAPLLDSSWTVLALVDARPEASPQAGALQAIVAGWPRIPVVALVGSHQPLQSERLLEDGAMEVLALEDLQVERLAEVIRSARARLLPQQRLREQLRADALARRCTDRLLTGLAAQAVEDVLATLSAELQLTSAVLLRSPDARGPHWSWPANLPAAELPRPQRWVESDADQTDHVLWLAQLDVRVRDASGGTWGWLVLTTGGTARAWSPTLMRALGTISRGCRTALDNGSANHGLGVPAHADDDTAGSAIQQRLRRAERLLRSWMPGDLGLRLLDGLPVAEELVPSATVLFADLVDFTPMASSLPAERTVEMLGQVFATFDRIAASLGVEKIKTIGDAWMGAAGLVESRPDHVDAVLQLAIELQKIVREFDEPDIGELRLRIGISTGAVVTGIIGETRLAYDLWGDTVNLAARLESQGLAGEIQVCGAVVAQASRRFHFRSRGRLSVKGRGRMETWFLTPTPYQWKRPLVLTSAARRSAMLEPVDVHAERSAS